MKIASKDTWATEIDGLARRLQRVLPRPLAQLGIDVLDLRALPGAKLPGPPALFAPRSRISADKGEAFFRGPLTLLTAANEERSGIVRTARLMVEEPDAARRSRLVVLAALVSLSRNTQEDWVEGADLARAIAMDHWGPLGSLWPNRTHYTLPCMPGFETLDVGDPAAVCAWIEAWALSAFSQYLPAGPKLTAVQRPSAIPVGALRAAFEMQDVDEAAQRGSEEWHSMSTERLATLVARFPLKALERRFGVSRATIRRTCERRGIERPSADQATPQAPAGT